MLWGISGNRVDERFWQQQIPDLNPSSEGCMPQNSSTRLLFICTGILVASFISLLILHREVPVGASSSFEGVLTWHNDNQRTGHNTSETVLSLNNVKSATFGKLFVIPTDGLVDAQPLYASNINVAGVSHNLLFVATEHGSVYGADADSGRVLWQVTTLGRNETTSDDRGCGQVTPEIGITSTPVIDLSAGPRGTIYVVAMSKDSHSIYHQRLHALDIATGAEEFGGPVEITAKYPGIGDNSHGGFVVFEPKQYKERAGLLLVNHNVYTTWASHCDDRPYTGWVISYNGTTLAQKSVLNVTRTATRVRFGMRGPVRQPTQTATFISSTRTALLIPPSPPRDSL